MALLLVIAVTAAVVSGAAVASDHDATVTVGNGTVGPNETTTVSVAIDRTSGGLSGFDLGLTVADGSVARIANASVADPADDITNVSVSDDGTTVRIAGVDGTDSVEGNATNVRLASVTLRGEAAGETRLSVGAVHGLQSDSGDRLATQTANGTVTVEEPAAAENGSADGSTDGSTPGFTPLIGALAVIGAALVAARRAG